MAPWASGYREMAPWASGGRWSAPWRRGGALRGCGGGGGRSGGCGGCRAGTGTGPAVCWSPHHGDGGERTRHGQGTVEDKTRDSFSSDH